MSAKTNMPPFVQKLVEELSRDRRKAAVLGVLLVVGIVLGVRALVGGSPAPVRAAVNTVMQARQEIDKADAAGSEASRDMKREHYIKQIDRKSLRDLFAFKEDLYPALEPVVVTTAPAATQTATGPDPVQEHRRLITVQAKSLTLQSVLSGDVPAVMINDRVLRVGDSINSFVLSEIGESSCVLQRDDVRVTLDLPRSKDKP